MSKIRCPFCGSDKYYIEKDEEQDLFNYWKDIKVYCRDCGWDYLLTSKQYWQGQNQNKDEK